MRTKYAVGQRVYLLGNDRRMPTGYVTVEKIGRKRATLSNKYRINLDAENERPFDIAWDADGCRSSKVFLEKSYAEDWEETNRLQSECSDLLRGLKSSDLGLAAWQVIHKILSEPKCS